MSRIRLMIVVDIFITEITGYILNHMTSMIDNGYELAILADDICDNSDAVIKKYGLYQKVKRHPLSSRINTVIYLIKVLIGCFFKRDVRKNVITIIKHHNIVSRYGIVYWIKAISALCVIDPNNIDIIHTHSIQKTYDYLFLKEIYDIPTVTTFHGMPTKYVRKLQSNMTKIVFDVGDLFFVNTEYAKRQIIKLGCDERKVKIIPQGTEIEKYPHQNKEGIENGQLNIMSLCRLSYDKGLEYIIDAVEILRKEFPYIKYRMIGSGPQQKQLEGLVKDRKLIDNIIITGRLPLKDVIEIFNLSDIFILASVRAEDGDYHEETQAVVIQEAQCIGIPVIATCVGGIPDCNKHEETAILINDKSSSEIAKAVFRLKNEPEMYCHLVKAGYQHVKRNFDNKKIAEMICSEYSGVLNHCGRRRVVCPK